MGEGVYTHRRRRALHVPQRRGRAADRLELRGGQGPLAARSRPFPGRFGQRTSPPATARSCRTLRRRQQISFRGPDISRTATAGSSLFPSSPCGSSATAHMSARSSSSRTSPNGGACTTNSKTSEQRLSIALSASSTGLWDYDPINDRGDLQRDLVPHARLRAAAGRAKRRSLPARSCIPTIGGLPRDDGAARAQARPCAVEVEFRMRRADGEWAWIRSIGKIIERDPAGRPQRADRRPYRYDRRPSDPERTRRRQGRRGQRQPGQERIPGHDESRNPHADERDHRPVASVGAHRTDAAPARLSRPRSRTPRRPCSASSTTSSTFRRSRPAS